jgi:two-component system, chemotaxis family, protein-glutamate methylesterase/glutaminase
MKPCRVLIVDDSAYNRTTLSRLVGGEADFEVVGTAADGEEALRKLMTLNPDVLTLDLDMPRMDGFTFLRIVMQKMPLPVVVVSSQAAAENIFKALELGAVDFVAKPTTNISDRLNEVAEELLTKLRMAQATTRHSLVSRIESPPRPATSRIQLPKRIDGVVAIGASTGGPGALQHILSRLPLLPVSLVIAQHMPAGFTRAFAERLDRTTLYQVAEAAHGEKLAAGHIRVAPGGCNLAVRAKGKSGELSLHLEEPKDDPFVPSVDKLFTSAAQAVGSRLLAVVCTGMGSDGAQGAVAVRNAAGTLYVESEETAVINGMPQAAGRLAGAQRTLLLGDLAKAIEQWARAINRETTGI